MSATQDPERDGGAPSARQQADPSIHSGHIDDLAAPYALGALDEATGRQVEAHVAGCAICGRFVAEAAHTVSFLPFLAHPAAPRAEAKQSLFLRIAQAQARPVPPAHVEDLSLPLPIDGGQVPPPAVRSELWQSLRRRLRAPFHLERPAETGGRRPAYTATLAVVPFVVALTVVSMWAMSLHGQLTEANGQVNALHSRVDTMKYLVADSANSFYEYQLTGGPAAPQASGKIYADPTQSVATLMVWDMNHSTTPQPYQILVEKNGQLVPVGQLMVDSSGTGTATFRLNGSLAQYRSIHIRAMAKPASATNLLAYPTAGDALSTEIDARVGNMIDTTAP